MNHFSSALILTSDMPFTYVRFVPDADTMVELWLSYCFASGTCVEGVAGRNLKGFCQT